MRYRHRRRQTGDQPQARRDLPRPREVLRRELGAQRHPAEQQARRRQDADQARRPLEDLRFPLPLPRRIPRRPGAAARPSASVVPRVGRRRRHRGNDDDPAHRQPERGPAVPGGAADRTAAGAARNQHESVEDLGIGTAAPADPRYALRRFPPSRPLLRDPDRRRRSTLREGVQGPSQRDGRPLQQDHRAPLLGTNASVPQRRCVVRYEPRFRPVDRRIPHPLGHVRAAGHLRRQAPRGAATRHARHHEKVPRG